MKIALKIAPDHLMTRTEGRCELTGLPTGVCACWEFLERGCTTAEARTAALEAVGIET